MRSRRRTALAAPPLRALRSLAMALLVAAALLLAVAAPAAQAQCTNERTFDPRVPTWGAVNGFPLGARAATVAELDRYLAAVDAASERVRTGTLATTALGRAVRYALVSRADRLGRVDETSAALRDLRRGEASAGAARAVAAREPAFAWIAAAAHGNEPSGSDASARLLYELAARQDCANLRRLDRLVTVIVPVQNPDGRERGTRTNSAGFDLNRDWFARTQPETIGEVELLRRLPPVLFVDAHEDAGRDFFFPPYADPVYHEIPSRGLRAMAGVFSPALREAFAARGTPYRTGGDYDFFFVGYGDSATTTAFGAAGMTFEKGLGAPLAERLEQQLLAQATALDAAAASKDVLLERWAAGWREARAEGARGRLTPNRALQPGGRPQFAVPGHRVYAYALRPDRAPSEVARLVERLRAFDVEVLRLRRPARIDRLDPYGPAGPRASRLPAGSFWIPMAQGPKHWIQALLNEETYVPFASFSDVSAWSNPLLMGVQGGAVGVSERPRGLRRIGSGAKLGTVPRRSAAAYALRADGTGALALLADLKRRGIAVRRATRTFEDAGAGRLPAGTAVLPGSTSLALLRDLAGPRQAPIVALREGVPARTRAVAPTRVAVLADLEPGLRASSAGWARWVVQRRLGLDVETLGAADLEAGALDRVQALVVADGALAPGELSTTALERLARWVGAGGTYVGLRARGVAVARAAGLTEERASALGGLSSPGALVAVEPAGAGPLTWSAGERIAVPDDDDPVLRGPAAAALRVAREDPLASGYLVGRAAIRGAKVATDQAQGAGRVILLAFDPGFRGYAEAAQRILGEAVLHPRAAASARGATSAGSARVRPGELRRLPALDERRP